jgi:demethylmenaquinone methyltransferase / 2-methoxy-6-polyprenyl-1,4-benzoquinol methylase
MNDTDQQRMVEPHPVLAGFYGHRAQRSSFVRRLFNETASHYDGLNRLFSLGSGAWYRRRCLLRAGLRPGCDVIDVAVGTGLLAQEIVAITGRAQDVIGIDLSEGMLAAARRKLAIRLVQGLAEQLPFADGSADFLTMGYALRHVADLAGAFGEFHRVLRHGGTIVLLEISKPTRAVSHALVSGYLGGVVPLVCRFTAGRRTRTLVEYYWETIENCVPPNTILAAMAKAGFAELRCDVDFDLFRSYIGRKR